MNYRLSELYFKRGNILLKMGLYHESIKAFDEALKIKIDHRYYYNKAVVLHRLGNFVYVEKALQQAIDCIKGSSEKSNIDKDILKNYEKNLLDIRNREKPLIWWEWWFSKSGGCKKFFGTFLFITLLFFVLGPLIVVTAGLYFQWLSVENMVLWGNWWVWYLVPIVILLVLLLSPSIRSISPQGLEMDLTMLKRKEESLEPWEKIIESRARGAKIKKKQ